MQEKLINLFKNKNFDVLEAELKALYPQIDYIDWEADYDGEIALHIVFVKMPYMLPFSGSAYAHFGDLDGSIYGETGLEQIMRECRVIEKEDVFEQYSAIEADNYAHDLKSRGYNLDKLDKLYGKEYNNALWEIIQEIKKDKEVR